MLAAAKAKTRAKLVLMEPFYLSDDPTQELMRVFAGYLKVVRKLAKEFEAILVPTHQQFQKTLAVRGPKEWSEDNVHPYPVGHAFIALGWLRAMGW
jgi:lysophospholipase L1-like esterase